MFRLDAKCLFVTALFMLIAAFAGAITYFDIYVDGVLSNTQIQGQAQVFEMDCVPLADVSMFLIVDADSDGVVDPDENGLINAIGFQDNNSEGMLPDLDDALGSIRVPCILNFPANHFVVMVTDEFDTVYVPYTVREPAGIDKSVSGTIELEGITPPTDIFEDIMVAAASFTAYVGYSGLVDSMGEYTVKWPADTGGIVVILTGFPVRGFDVSSVMIPLSIYGHETGVDIFVPIGDSATVSGRIVDEVGDGITAESLFVLYPTERSIAETTYIDVADGDFSVPVPGDISYKIEYYDFPADFMIQRIINLDFNVDFGEEKELNLTLYRKNSSMWFSYTADPGPVAIDVPIRLDGFWGHTGGIVPPDSTVEVGMADYSATNHYTVSLDCDDCLPGAYGLWVPLDTVFYQPFVYPGDTVDLVLREMMATVAGTLFDPGGDPISRLAEMRYNRQMDYVMVEEILAGVFEIPVFDNTNYVFVPQADDYMTPVERYVRPDTGIYTMNWTLYPLDELFWINLHEDVPEDEELQITITYAPSGDYSMLTTGVGEWESRPIYSGFTDSCYITVHRPSGIFDRLVENNGEIPVTARDSVFIDVVLPLDHFCINWSRDMEDHFEDDRVWVQAGHYILNYYDPDDSSLVYSTEDYPTGDMDIPCVRCGFPIFADTVLFKLESSFDELDEHVFLANPWGMLIGGDISPDTIDAYYNYACYHLWIHLDGYPAYYLDEPQITLHMAGVELPDHPEYEFAFDFDIADNGEGDLRGYHQLCDGSWSFELPDSLPGGFMLSVTETTIFVPEPDSFDWPRDHMHIGVLWPEGVHGNVFKDTLLDPPIPTRYLFVKLHDPTSDTVIDSIRVFRNIDTLQYISGLVEPGDYIARLEYFGSSETPFVYPAEVALDYAGGDTVLPDMYIGYAYGEVRVELSGLMAGAYPGANVEFDMLPDSAWFDITAEFPVADTTMIIGLCNGEWVATPPEIAGYSVAPAETTFSIIAWPTNYELNFSYSLDTALTGAIDGWIVRDVVDPSPIALDSFTAALWTADIATMVDEIDVDILGGFGFFLLPPDTYCVMLDYGGDREAFIIEDSIEVEVAMGDTTIIGPVYVDNANASLIVRIEGLEATEISIESIDFSTDIEYLPDTFSMPYTPYQSEDTFLVCDAQWTVYAPAIDTFSFEPSETTFVIDESAATYEVVFSRTAEIDEKDVLPRELSIAVYPNPFNAETHIEVQLPEDGRVKLSVMNINGKTIKVITNRRFAAGRHLFEWDGIGPSGASVGSGIYFIEVDTDAGSRAVKGLFIK